MSDTSEVPGRVGRAFRDHGSFEQESEGRYVHTATAFDGEVGVQTTADGHVRFDVTVTVPMLDAVTEGHVAPVVEDGWFETFELRVVDVGGVTRKSREFDVAVERDGETAVVETSLTDINEQRGVDDAGALINFVEGTYVQGIIPGYDYRDPVASLLSNARQQGQGSGSF